MSGTEIIFEVTDDELDGGFSASALGFGIHTQGETIDELHRNVREAVDCQFDDGMTRPRLIRLHNVWCRPSGEGHVGRRAPVSLVHEYPAGPRRCLHVRDREFSLA